MFEPINQHIALHVLFGFECVAFIFAEKSMPSDEIDQYFVFVSTEFSGRDLQHYCELL